VHARRLDNRKTIHRPATEGLHKVAYYTVTLFYRVWERLWRRSIIIIIIIISSSSSSRAGSGRSILSGVGSQFGGGSAVSSVACCTHDLAVQLVVVGATQRFLAFTCRAFECTRQSHQEVNFMNALITIYLAQRLRRHSYYIYNGVFTRSSKRPAIHVYFEYIFWKFAGRLLDRANTL